MTETDPGELMQRVGHELVRAAPAGWVTVSMVYRRVGRTAESQATGRAPDGTLLDVRVDRTALRALKELRAAMARPGTGAWLTAWVHVSRDGRMTWDLDRDHEPEWFVPVSPLHYLQEQEEFPRDEEHIPGWMRERLDEARALGGL